MIKQLRQVGLPKKILAIGVLATIFGAGSAFALHTIPHTNALQASKLSAITIPSQQISSSHPKTPQAASPAPTVAAPAKTAPTTSTVSTTATAKTSSVPTEPVTDEPAAPLMTASGTSNPGDHFINTTPFTATSNWAINYNYSCDGPNGINAIFVSSTSTSFGLNLKGGTSGSIGPIAPTSGYLRVYPPDNETCTWQITAN